MHVFNDIFLHEALLYNKKRKQKLIISLNVDTNNALKFAPKKMLFI